MIRTLALALAIATPAAAGWSVAYAPGTNLERLDVAALGRATRSIDIAAYILSDVPVIDALAAALERLRAAPNVEVREKTHGTLMHLKSYLVDRTLLRGGAANFSASGLKHQDNDRFETNDAEAVKAFQSAFDAMWAR